MGVRRTEIGAVATSQGAGGSGGGSLPWAEVIISADGPAELNKANLLGGSGLTITMPTDPEDGDRVGFLSGGGGNNLLDAGVGKNILDPMSINGSSAQTAEYDLGNGAYIEFKWLALATTWYLSVRSHTGAVMSVRNEGSEQGKFIQSLDIINGQASMSGSDATIDVSAHNVFPDFGAIKVINDTMDFNVVNRLDVTGGGPVLLPAPSVDGQEIIWTVVYGSDSWDISATIPVVVHGTPEGSATNLATVSGDTRGGVLKYSSVMGMWYLFLGSNFP